MSDRNIPTLKVNDEAVKGSVSSHGSSQIENLTFPLPEKVGDTEFIGALLKRASMRNFPNPHSASQKKIAKVDPIHPIKEEHAPHADATGHAQEKKDEHDDHHDAKILKVGRQRSSSYDHKHQKVFELFAEEKEGTHNVEDLLENNKLWAASVRKQDPYYFLKSASFHAPSAFFIGCSDARSPPERLLLLQPGDLFIHRNIANQVLQGDLNCNAQIQYAIFALNVRDIIVMGHSGCGGVKASLHACHYAVVDQWITNIRDLYEINSDLFDGIKDDKEKVNILSKLNVRFQCVNLQKNANIRRARKKGFNIKIHGWFLDLEKGYIENIPYSDDYEEIIRQINRQTLGYASDLKLNP